MPVELTGNMPSRMPSRMLFMGGVITKPLYNETQWGSGYQLGAAGLHVLQDPGAKEPVSAAGISCCRSHVYSSYWKLEKRQKLREVEALFLHYCPRRAVPGEAASHWELLATPGTGHW